MSDDADMKTRDWPDPAFDVSDRSTRQTWHRQTTVTSEFMKTKPEHSIWTETHTETYIYIDRGGHGGTAVVKDGDRELDGDTDKWMGTMER